MIADSNKEYIIRQIAIVTRSRLSHRQPNENEMNIIFRPSFDWAEGALCVRVMLYSN